MLRLLTKRTGIVTQGRSTRYQSNAITSLSFTGESTNKKPEAKALRDDVKDLGKILGACIKNNDPVVFDNVEKLRKLGRQWRSPEGDQQAFQQMVEDVKQYDAKTLLGIARSFSNFLALANSAENHHRVRRLKESLTASGTPYGLWSKEDSCAGSIDKLKNQLSVKPEEIFHAIKTQQVELVLTAHPTEVNRRTMLRKHRRVKEILEQFDRTDISNFDRRNLQEQLHAEISSIWESDNLRRTKPTPVDEARAGLAVMENVFWDAVPNFVRKLQDVVKGELGGSELPLTYAPIKIASWMGGDRDGNPNVTPNITVEVAMLSRWSAASMYKQEIAELRASLSMKPCTDELSKASNAAREPYREILKRLETRLQATMDWSAMVVQKIQQKEPYLHHLINAQVDVPLIKSARDLLDPLLMIHRSLLATGMTQIANGALLDNIRRLAAFGVTLMPLDIRQESTRHTEALDAITRYLGIGSYAQWDELTRRNWIQNELSSRRPLMPRGCDYTALGFSPTVVDTLHTFAAAAALEKESLGAYVISQCQQASDILAVALLQQDAGCTPLMRVVPLFETLDDLQRAPATVEALFSITTYRGRIENKQEIMVGYSDSAKDAGRIAASWAQYNSQLSMVEVAKKAGVELTFFHGKGGTVGRGGNPALYHAILAHPPGTINGRFRITEQGEMITQNFGQVAVAERTFDLFTAGVLSERFIPRPEVKDEWRAMMERLSQLSCDAYRQVVRGEPRFVPYFRAATPELELSDLNVGSRPPKRNPTGGVDSLRAIPWNFAWTQTRLNLPTWLGVGEAFQQELQEHPDVIKEMFHAWPWFATLVDLLEMILVKSDSVVAQNYDTQLVRDAESIQLGEELRQRLLLTAKSVLAVSGNTALQAHNPGLLKSLAVRNPYIDPLNIIQAELLSRLRRSSSNSNDETSQTTTDTTITTTLPAEDRVMLQDALMITINGVANGMRNSG